MKRLLLPLLLAAGLAAHAQWYTGWSEATGLALSLHLTDSTPQLFSPLQSPDPLPVSQWSLAADTLRIDCASLGFKATLVRQGEQWHGVWRQGLVRETIDFLPADTLLQLRRPQTPQPPYHFIEEEVAADYTDSQGNAVHLVGTLTLPTGRTATVPCIVMVSGSGQQNRDEELFHHRPFLVLADYLAAHGIAMLRYDDRGVGQSTGSLDSADTYLFAEDAEAMLHAVATHPAINPLRLGIGGHSEGGAIAPIVAARNPAIRFVVMLAGQGCTGLNVLVQQNEALLVAKGVSPSLARRRGACVRDLLTLPPEASVKEMRAVIARHLDSLSPAQADSIALRKGEAYAFHQQLASRWMRSFVGLDPAAYLPQVTCPVLALNGALDRQVVPEPNLQRIRQLCPQAACRMLPGLNHLFQHCLTGSPTEYVQIEETLAPEAMQAVADWILHL